MTAKSLKARSNITYLIGDATATLDSYLTKEDAPSRILMNASLAYFKPAGLGTILNNLGSFLRAREYHFLITDIPDDSRRDHFYDTPERKERHLANTLSGDETNDGLGRWWKQSEISDLCMDHGLGVRFLSQPEELSTYRIDAIIHKTVASLSKSHQKDSQQDE